MGLPGPGISQGKAADALKALDAAEKDAVTAKLEAAVLRTQLLRAHFALENGKFADALKFFGAAEKSPTATLNEGQKTWLAALRLGGVVEAQARLGKVADAEKSLAQLQELYKATPGDVDGADFIAYARGAIALQKKDYPAAIEALKKASEPFAMGKLLLAEVQDAAKDSAGATDTLKTLTRTNYRDQLYCWAYATAIAKLKTPGKKVASESGKK